ncbi:MAG: STAS domain-containing protein [Magnetospirillum gryphiswaldense]|nr:STAS domain-containing protein [Magnetospirillum gryphiswaldense]
MGQTLDYKFDGDSIHLSGDLVFDAHPQWRQMLRQMPAPRPNSRIRLDMTGLRQLDAAGLGLLLITHDTLKAQGASLTVAAPQGQVRRVLEVSGFAAMVEIEA